MKDTKELTADRAPNRASLDEPLLCVDGIAPQWVLRCNHHIDGFAADPSKWGVCLGCAFAAISTALTNRERAAQAAPSSPSDLSARETEDQQELTRAAVPRSPDEWARHVAGLYYSGPDALDVLLIAAMTAVDRAAESRGRERGIEEAARRCETLAHSPRGDDYGSVGNTFDECAEAIRALTSGASAPTAPPKDTE